MLKTEKMIMKKIYNKQKYKLINSIDETNEWNKTE